MTTDEIKWLRWNNREVYQKMVEDFDSMAAESDVLGLKRVSGRNYVDYLLQKGEVHVADITADLFKIRKGGFHWKAAKQRANSWLNAAKNRGVVESTGTPATWKLTKAARDAETARKELLKPIPDIPAALASALNTPIDTKPAPAVATGGKGK